MKQKKLIIINDNWVSNQRYINLFIHRAYINMIFRSGIRYYNILYILYKKNS